MVANAYRVEEKTVTVYTRFLKEAGLMTTGARGVNAPHMLPIDAARITIALLATDNPSKCVERTERFSKLQLHRESCVGDLPSEMVGGEHDTLEQVLIRIFAGWADSPVFGLNPYVEINENAKTAVIEYSGSKRLEFRDANKTEAILARDRKELLGIRRSRGVASAELLRIWVEMWHDRFEGWDADGLPLDPSHPWNMELVGYERQSRIEQIEAYIKARDVDWWKGAD